MLPTMEATTALLASFTRITRPGLRLQRSFFVGMALLFAAGSFACADSEAQSGDSLSLLEPALEEWVDALEARAIYCDGVIGVRYEHVETTLRQMAKADAAGLRDTNLCVIDDSESKTETWSWDDEDIPHELNVDVLRQRVDLSPKVQTLLSELDAKLKWSPDNLSTDQEASWVKAVAARTAELQGVVDQIDRMRPADAHVVTKLPTVKAPNSLSKLLDPNGPRHLSAYGALADIANERLARLEAEKDAAYKAEDALRASELRLRVLARSASAEDEKLEDALAAARTERLTHSSIPASVEELGAAVALEHFQRLTVEAEIASVKASVDALASHKSGLEEAWATWQPEVIEAKNRWLPSVRTLRAAGASVTEERARAQRAWNRAVAESTALLGRVKSESIKVNPKEEVRARVEGHLGALQRALDEAKGQLASAQRAVQSAPRTVTIPLDSVSREQLKALKRYEILTEASAEAAVAARR